MEDETQIRDADGHLPASPLPEIGILTFGEIRESLKCGFRDFMRAPAYGLFFSGAYVLGGLLLVWLGAGHITWILAVTLGFPLAAPFAAVGLYEVSRRLEAGTELNWKEILGVLWLERTRQIPWIGAIIVLYFLFWTFLAHMIFALFMGLTAITNISQSWAIFFEPEGLKMIAVGSVVGGVLAFFLFSLTVVSLPLLLEKEIDFISAMILSVRTVALNGLPMLAWAAFIAVTTLLAMLPLFLGLLVVMPILGHTTWHLYRRVLYDPVQS